jgi:hypothetical protein
MIRHTCCGRRKTHRRCWYLATIEVDGKWYCHHHAPKRAKVIDEEPSLPPVPTCAPTDELVGLSEKFDHILKMSGNQVQQFQRSCWNLLPALIQEVLEWRARNHKGETSEEDSVD